ncbi:relaxase/mobilization nuclease domain-containing protein, partial [Methylocucumis oryzae]
MIIKARAGKGGKALAAYLTGGKNERAEVLEFRNMDAVSLKAAIYDMDILAEQSRCQNHALHVQMRAAEGERLSGEQWRDAADRYAAAFGLEEHQAALVLHSNPDGSTHCHIVFNRVHPETLKAADLWQNYKTHKTLARQIELDYGLQNVTNEKTQARDHSRAGRPETEQARRTGENIHDIRERIRR